MKNRKPIWNVRRNDLGNVTVKARETGLAIVHDGTTYDEAHVFATMGRLELTLRSTRAIVLPVTGDLFCQSPAGWHQAGQLEAVARGEGRRRAADAYRRVSASFPPASAS